MTNKNFKKIVPLLILCLLVLGLFLPGNARAQETAPKLNWWSCAKNLVSCGIYGVTYVITTIMGFLVSVGAWLTQEALAFNQGVVSSPAVEKGFAVSLSIANLGFVLGIIVIALATILRRQTYGIKQILWKLIMMAILVNFGLVIAGAILGFSDSFTSYFISTASGTCDFKAGTCFSGFVTKLTQGFAPQSLFKPPLNVDLAGDLSDVIKGVLNMLFIIVFLLIVAFTFFALAVLLLIRYVYIGILLILLPLAWLLYVFPQFSSKHSQWWSSFLRWTFFPPLVVFFLYLAMLTAATKDSGYIKDFAASTVRDAGTANAGGSVINLTGADAGESGILASAAQMIIVVGLAIGGLFAANKLSITGASTAMGMMKSAGGTVKGFAKRRAQRASSYLLRTEAGRKATAAVQGAGLGMGRVGRLLTKPVRELGTAAAKARGPSEKQVSDRQRDLSRLSLEEQARRIGTETAPGQLAIMKNLQKSMNAAPGSQERLAAQAAFDSLPSNVKGKLDRLNMLYGKGTTVTTAAGKTTPATAGPGVMSETFAGGGGTKAPMDRMENELNRREGKGENVGELKRVMEDLRAIEARRERAEMRRAGGDKSPEVERAIREEGQRSREMLAQLRERVKSHGEKGNDVKNFEDVLNDLEDGLNEKLAGSSEAATKEPPPAKSWEYPL